MGFGKKDDKKKKVKKDDVEQIKASNFIKKINKNKGSNLLLFGETKEEKLKLFIMNMKIINPNIPDFWLKKDIDKFKKKFNM